MRVLSFSSIPAHSSCLKVACVPQMLERPILDLIPVVDDAGIEYGTSVALSDSFYGLVFAYFAMRWAVRAAFDAYQKNRNRRDED